MALFVLVYVSDVSEVCACGILALNLLMVCVAVGLGRDVDV